MRNKYKIIMKLTEVGQLLVSALLMECLETHQRGLVLALPQQVPHHDVHLAAGHSFELDGNTSLVFLIRLLIHAEVGTSQVSSASH